MNGQYRRSWMTSVAAAACALALLAGCSSAPQGAGASSASAPAIKGDAADPGDEAAGEATDAGTGDAGTGDAGAADEGSASEESSAADANGEQAGSAEPGAGESDGRQEPDAGTDGDASGEGDSSGEGISYDIPEDTGDWELPPDNPEEDPDWGVPTELLTEDYDGVNLPTEAEIEELLRQWQALIDQWNQTWSRPLPDPRLPDPETTSIEPRNDANPKGLPSVSYQDDLKLSHDACVGGSATYTVKIDGQAVRSGAMTETRPGHYEAIVAATAPSFGSTSVDISVVCPAGGREGTGFDMYIDPSGTIVDQDGNLLVGARAVLLRADSKDGPYVVVPDGSAIMSPSNRQNPWVTGKDGVFQWDVVKGWYVVRTYADGCTHPTDPKTEFGQTDALEVPPPRLGLTITMKCSSKAKVIKTIQVSKPGSVSGKGAVGSTLKATTPKANGAKVAVSWQRVSKTGTVTPIPGATGATYRVVAADKGSTVRPVFALSKAGYAAKQVAAKGLRISKPLPAEWPVVVEFGGQIRRQPATRHRGEAGKVAEWSQSGALDLTQRACPATIVPDAFHPGCEPWIDDPPDELRGRAVEVDAPGRIEEKRSTHPGSTAACPVGYAAALPCPLQHPSRLATRPPRASRRSPCHTGSSF